MKTLAEVVQELASHGEKPALLIAQKDEVISWSFADIGQQAACLSTGLRKAGLGTGKRALLLAPNGPEWVFTCLALLQAGAVPVLVDTQMGRDELRHVLSDSEARWVFTVSETAHRLRKVREDLRFDLLDADAKDSRSWRRLMVDDVKEGPQVDPDQTAAIFYTSGTSGKPKGVPLSHTNLCSNLAAIRELGLLQPADRLLLPLPLHHIYPFTVGLLTPFASGVAVIMPSMLTGPELFRALGRCRATVMIGVPRLYTALDAAIRGRLKQSGRVVFGSFRAALFLSVFLERRLKLTFGRRLFAPLRRKVAPDLRLVVSGGAALDPNQGWRLQAMGWEVASGYGLTETSPVVSFNLPGRGFDSVGKPLARIEVKISPVNAESENGEVLVKGPNVFSGYLNLPDETERSFTEDGYFRTKDLGDFDSQGALRLVGRRSSMIVLPSGENIQPEAIENVLEQSDAIKEAGVLQRDERLVALLVPRKTDAKAQGEDHTRVSKDAERVVNRLPSHHRPSVYALTPNPLPRTRLGKIRRHELEKRFDQAQNGGAHRKRVEPVPMDQLAPEDRQLLDHPKARKIWEWLPQRFPNTQLSTDTNLKSDLGLDSLDWVELSAEIHERAGAYLDGAAMSRIESVRDLLREAAESANGGGEGRDWATGLRKPEQLLEEDQLKWLEPAKPWVQLIGRMLFRMNRLLMRRLFRLDIRGMENLPQKGPLVIISNHVSRLDSLAIAASLPYSLLAKTYWGGWTGVMFKNRFMRAVSRAARVFPVDPEKDPLASLALGAAVLKVGNILVWYPEGAVSETGKLQEFRPGIGFLLQALPVPCVPLWVEGTEKALPPDRRWPRIVPIRVRVGATVEPGELVNREEHEQPEQRIATALKNHVLELAH